MLMLQFLQEAGTSHMAEHPTYNEDVRKLRETEFSHAAGITYLDHAGATLYAKSQLEAHYGDLTANLYGNPHSQNPSSRLTTDTVDYVRDVILRHFNTSSAEYDVVFTSGCTGALRLLSESFPWRSGRDCELRATNRDGSRSFPGSGGKSSLQVANQQGSRLPADSRGDVVYTHGRGAVSDRGREGPEGRLATDGCECSGDSRCVLDGDSSVFCYLEDNHTSVVGMREVAARNGARIFCATEHEVVLTDDQFRDTGENCSADLTRSKVMASEETQQLLANGSANEAGEYPTDSRTETPPTSPSPSPSPQDQPETHHLFAYPAQSNFSGRKYPLSWIGDLPTGRVHVTTAGSKLRPRGSWKVLLDAAAFVSTNPLDLSRHPAHFVAVSFYKMFGFPTGLGALLVCSDCTPLLRKSYYGGGTVVATISREQFHIPRAELHNRLEDGTLPFLGIVALRHGFDALQRLGRSMECVSRHTFALARHVHHCLSQLRHGNGRPVCVVYSDTDFEDRHTQGAIVNFNLLRADGQFVGYSEVDKLACVQDIHLRTGCFCNTGACMRFLGLSSERVKANVEAGHVCGDDVDLVDGYPTGSVRISFGYMSTQEDAQKFVRFIEQCFVDKKTPAEQSTEIQTDKKPATASRPLVPPTSPSLQESLVSAREILDSKPAAQDITGVSTSLERQEPEATARAVSLSPMEGTSNRSCSCTTCSNAVASSTGEGAGEPCLLPVSGCLGVGDVIEAWSSGQEGTYSCSTVRLEKISLYPVKSCAAFQVSRWPLGSKGLLFDREWMVLSELGACLSQKQEPRLCLVQPSVDLATRKMTLRARGGPSLEVPLDTGEPEAGHRGQGVATHLTRICGDRVQGLDCGEAAARWVSHVLSRKCRLVRQSPGLQRKAWRKQPAGDESIPLSLANEGQYLLVSSSSVADFHRAMTGETTNQPRRERKEEEEEEESQDGVWDLTERFRSNLVVGGDDLKPYVEDDWETLCLHARDLRFKVTGRCSRCQIISVDQRSARRSPEPLQTLLALRGNKATFGVYLAAHGQRESELLGHFGPSSA